MSNKSVDTTKSRLSAYGKLTLQRLIRFGIPEAEAIKIIAQDRIAHRFGPGRGEVEYLDLRWLREHRLWGLEFAEHVARVFHNWGRCHTVDTTRLAMAAR